MILKRDTQEKKPQPHYWDGTFHDAKTPFFVADRSAAKHVENGDAVLAQWKARDIDVTGVEVEPLTNEQHG